MKKYLIIFVFFYSVSFISYADKIDIENILYKAKQYFQTGEYENAIEILSPAVESGHPLATYLTGIVYFRSTPKGEPPILALSYFEKSALLGHTAAHLDIAFAYQQGSGLQQDFTKAKRHYLFAFEGDDKRVKAIAAYAIGGLYLNGMSVEQNEEIAKDWYTKSSNLGYSDATTMLNQLNRK